MTWIRKQESFILSRNMSHSTYSREIYLESLKNELVFVVLITQHESKEKYAEDIMALSNSPQRLRP